MSAELVKIPYGKAPEEVIRAFESVRDALAAVPAEQTLSFPFVTTIKNLAEQPLFVATFDLEITSASFAAQAAALATDISIDIFRRGSDGKNATKVAFINRNSPSTTAWLAMQPKALAFTGSSARVKKGEVVTLSTTCSAGLASLIGTLTVQIRGAAQ